MNFFEELKQLQADKSNTVFIHRLAEVVEPKRPWKRSYRPSSISYSFCPRLWALMGLGYAIGTSKADAIGQRRMDNGTLMHQRYHDYTEIFDNVYKDVRYGDPENDYKCEERLLETHKIRGKYDAILEHTDGVLYVTDFKSIKHEQFEKLIKPLDYHVTQLVLYLGMVDELYDLDRPICGLYVYESKNTQEVKEFKVRWDDEAKDLYNHYLTMIAAAENAIDTEDLSDVPCTCNNKNPCKSWDLEELKKKPKIVNL